MKLGSLENSSIRQTDSRFSAFQNSVHRGYGSLSPEVASTRGSKPSPARSPPVLSCRKREFAFAKFRPFERASGSGGGGATGMKVSDESAHGIVPVTVKEAMERTMLEVTAAEGGRRAEYRGQRTIEEETMSRCFIMFRQSWRRFHPSHPLMFLLCLLARPFHPMQPPI